MDIEAYRNHCVSKEQVTEEFPFPSLPNLLVFKVAGKMFTATDIMTFESISVKCNPDQSDEIRATYPAVTGHKYFKGPGWNLVKMDRSIPDKVVFEWINTSYKLAIEKLPKRIRSTFGY